MENRKNCLTLKIFIILALLAELCTAVEFRQSNFINHQSINMNGDIVDVKNVPEAEQLSTWLAIIGIFFIIAVVAISIAIIYCCCCSKGKSTSTKSESTQRLPYYINKNQNQANTSSVPNIFIAPPPEYNFPPSISTSYYPHSPAGSAMPYHPFP